MSNKEAVKKYQEKRDSIMLRPSKEDGQIIRDAAKAAGQSVQAYIFQAVNDRIDRDEQQKTAEQTGTHTNDTGVCSGISEG